MASVSVEFSAYLDPRFTLLGSLSGKTRFDAIGRMGAIWIYCIEKCQATHPAAMIDALAEMPGYSQWMVDAALAERADGDQIRIKGTEGRIEWLEQARYRQRKATKAAAAAAEKKRQSKSEDRKPKIDPILDPKSDPISAPPLESSSASTPASTLKTEIHIDQRKRRSRVQSAFDLEAAYNLYPRKVGKTKGLQKLAKEIRSQEDYDALFVAIRHYSNSREVREGYVRHFSTFVTDWRDWLDPETGSTRSSASMASAGAVLNFGGDT